MKNIEIVLKSSDVKMSVDSDMLIDKVSLAVDGRTEDDMTQDAMEYELGSFDYVFEYFDFEDALIDYFERQFDKACFFFFDGMGLDAIKIKNEIKRSTLKAGAFLALNYPEIWERKVEEFEDQCNENKFDYNDENSLLEELSPKLRRELAESVEDYWKQQHKEWVHGDYGHWAGIERLFARDIGAKAIYQDAHDLFIIEFTDEEARDFMAENYRDDDSEGKNITAKELKAAIAERIASKAIENLGKERARIKEQNERFAKEREYKAQRKAEAEQERIKKLKAMKKK